MKRTPLKRRYNHKQKLCKQCGTDFLPTVGHQKYCGRECRLEGLKTVVNECQFCKESFTSTPGRNQRRFCSQACSSKANAQNRLGQVGRFGLGTSYAKPERKVICPVCSISFSTAIRKQVCCSKSCRSTLIAAQRRGSAKPVGRKWGLNEKDERICRNCGNEAHHLHHIVPRSKARNGREDLANGLPLCRSCHMGWHHKTVTIFITALKLEELQCAMKLADPVWMERNYPFPSVPEQADLVERAGGLEEAYQWLTRGLGESAFSSLSETSPSGVPETLKELA